MIEAPVKAAFIAATAAVIIAVAQITSQWLLALRAEKANNPKEKPDIQKMTKYILRRTLRPGLILSTLLQLYFIFSTVSEYFTKPIPGIVSLFLSFQVTMLTCTLLLSLIIDYYHISLRYVLTGSPIRKDEES